MTSAVVEATELYRFFHAGDEEVMALRGVSLVAAPGEFVAVVGPSGSGKTTLLACLAGLDDPDGGVVRVAGRVMSRRPEREKAGLRATHLGIVLQSANLVEHLTLRGNLLQAHRLASRREAGDDRSGPADGPGIDGPGTDGPDITGPDVSRPNTDRPDIDALLARVGLAGRARAYPAQLSGGEAVRAGLAVALVNRPPVVLGDEPTAEIDRATEAQLLELLRAEVARGLTLVVATHSPAVADAADRVITLADGRVVA
ncbi:MAG: putative transport system ATP-binding protein [Acidimicrobiaceae bacterium]|nr:putative transport system ATP-binding protein [Acidimicrobiaceae bacterium]